MHFKLIYTAWTGTPSLFPSNIKVFLQFRNNNFAVFPNRLYMHSFRSPLSSFTPQRIISPLEKSGKLFYITIRPHLSLRWISLFNFHSRYFTHAACALRTKKRKRAVFCPPRTGLINPRHYNGRCYTYLFPPLYTARRTLNNTFARYVRDIFLKARVRPTLEIC